MGQNSHRAIERQVSNISDTIDSARGSKKLTHKRANFMTFQKAWGNYKELMDNFWADQAAERLDSVGPEMEEFFEVNEDDDGNGIVNNVMQGKGSIDFYNR